MNDLAVLNSAAEILLEDEYAPEFALDPNDPQNDDYFRSKKSLEQALHAQTVKIGHRKVQAARLLVEGATRADIARQIGRTAQTVSKWSNDPEVRRYVALLTRYRNLIDGPNEELRKNVLWRITAACERERPNISIAAIQELNKMSGAYAQQNANGPVTVVINQSLLPRGELDHGGHTIDGEVDAQG